MQYRFPLEVIRIDGQGYHLIIRAVLHGYTMNLVLDTGATRSVLDLNRSLKIMPNAQPRAWNKLFSGIGGDNLQTTCLAIDDLYLGEVLVPPHEFILLDMQQINQVYASFDLPRIDGVLGGDLMMQYHAVVHYKDRYLQLEI